MSRDTWTADLTAKLRDLWSRGHSCSRIAAALGGGLTRNAIIGKVSRLQLAPRATTNAISSAQYQGALNKKRRATSPPPTRIAPTPLPPAEVPATPPISFADLEPHHCRWPFGDGPFMFCGGDRIPGAAYCVHHQRKAFVTPDVRVRNDHIIVIAAKKDLVS